MANDERDQNYVLKPVLKILKSRKHKISDAIELSKVSLFKTDQFQDAKQILSAGDLGTELEYIPEKMPSTPKKGGSNLDWGAILLDDGLPTNEMPPKQKDKPKTTHVDVVKLIFASSEEKKNTIQEAPTKRVVSNNKLPDPHNENVAKPKSTSPPNLPNPYYEKVEKPINKMPPKRSKIVQKGETIETPLEVTMPTNNIPKKSFFRLKRAASPPDELPPPCPELPKNVIPPKEETLKNVCGSKAHSRPIQPFEKRKKPMAPDIPRPLSMHQVFLDPQKLKETQRKIAESKRPTSITDNIKLKPGAYKVHDNRRRSTTPPITVHKYTPSRTYQKEHLIKEGEPTAKQADSKSNVNDSSMVNNKDGIAPRSSNENSEGLKKANSEDSKQQVSTNKSQGTTPSQADNTQKPVKDQPVVETQKKPVTPQHTMPQANKIHADSKVPDPTQVQVAKTAVVETKSKISVINKKIGKKGSKRKKQDLDEDGKPKEMEFEYREEPRLYIKPPKHPLSKEVIDSIRTMEKDVVPENLPKNYRTIQAPLKPGEVPETYLMKLKAKMQKEADEKALDKANESQQQKELPRKSASVRGCRLTTQEPPRTELTNEALAKKKEELKAEALREASLVASKALQEVKKIFQNAENKFIPIAKEAISVDKTLKEGVISLIDTMSEETIGNSSDQNVVSNKKGAELLPNLKKENTFTPMNNKNTVGGHSEKSMTNKEVKKPPISTSTWNTKQNINDISEASDIYTIPRSLNADHQVPTSIWGEISLEENNAYETERHPKLAGSQTESTQVEVLKQAAYEFSDKNDSNTPGKNPTHNNEMHQSARARISSEQETEKVAGSAQNTEGKGQQGESNVRNNPNYLARRYATDLVRNPGPVMFRPPASSSSSSGTPPRDPPKQTPPPRGPPTSGQGSDDGSGKDPPEIKVLLPPNSANQSVQATIKVEFQIVQDENDSQSNQENKKIDPSASASKADAKIRSPGTENPYVNLVSKDISRRKSRTQIDKEQKNIQKQEAQAIPVQQINSPSQNQNQKFVTPHVRETQKLAQQNADEQQVNENMRANTSIADVNVYYYDAESMDANDRLEKSMKLAKEGQQHNNVHFIDEGRVAAAALLAAEKKKAEMIKLADAGFKEEAIKLADKLKMEAVKLAEEKIKIEAMKLAAERRKLEEIKLAEATKLAEERKKLEDLKLAEENRKAAAAKLAEEMRRAEQLRLEEEKKKADALKLAEEQKKAEALKLAEEKKIAEALKLAEEKKKAEALRLAEEKKKAEELKLAEEKKRAEALKLAEEKKKAEELKLAEEKKRAEALKLAEEKKKAEELKLAEEKKKAEALKLAEEKKRAEALKLAEEKKKTEALKLAEEKKRAEAMKLAEEKKRAEALRLAEEKKRAEALRLAEEKKKAEALRLAEERKKAEALRLAEEKKKAEALKLAEERRKAEEVRVAAEKRKAEAIKLAAERQKAEEVRRAAEKKKAEAIRLAAERKKAEELRLAEEKKKIEAIRLAEEKRKLDEVKAAEEKKRIEGIKLAEEKWKAEAFKLSEEKRKVEALRASEERWRTEALKLAEEKKRADAIRLAEEKRRAIEIKFEQEKLKVESLRLSEEKWKAEAIKLAAEKQMAIASKIAEERRQVEAARLAKEEEKARAIKLAEDKRKAEAFQKAEEARKAAVRQQNEEKQKGEAFNKDEQRKIDEGVKLAEEKRVAQEFKLAEEKRKAEELKQAEEKKKTEALRLAEEKRKTEEMKLAEENKKAEAIRQARAEEMRLADEKKQIAAMKLTEGMKRAEEIKLAVQKKAAEAMKLAEERKRAEALRIAEEKRRAEEIKIAEGGKKAAMVKLTEEKRKEEEIKLAEEKKKAEAIKLAEEKWKAQVVKQAEEKRLAEEIRSVEEKKRAEAEKRAEEKRKAEAIKIAAEQKRMEAIKLAEAKKIEEIRKFNEGKKKVETAAEKEKAQIFDRVKEDEREVITKVPKEAKYKDVPVTSISKEEGRTDKVARVTSAPNVVEQRATSVKNELQQSSIKVGDKQKADEKESTDSDKKRRTEALKLTEVKRNAEAIKQAEQRSRSESLKAAAEAKVNEEKRKLEEAKAADLKKKHEYLALIEKKRKAQAANLAEETKKDEALRSVNEKKVVTKTSPASTIWPVYEGSKLSQEKLKPVPKKTNSATLKTITPKTIGQSPPPKKTSQPPSSKSNTEPVIPSADAVPFEKNFGTFYDWTTPSSLARKAALHMDMPIHRQGQRRVEGMKREIGITSANKMYQMSAPCSTNLPKPATPCPICPDAPAPAGGAPGSSAPPANIPPPPGDLPSRPSSSASHDSEPPRTGPAQLSGISKYFNSQTISGRANVAKATFAVMGLYALNRMMRKPSKESKPHAKR